MQRIGPNSPKKSFADKANPERGSSSSLLRTSRSTLSALPCLLAARILAVILISAAAVGFICPERAIAQSQLTLDTPSHRALVIAFVGGFVHSDDARHSEIQIARKLQSVYGKDVQVEIFRNRDRQRAHKLIQDWWQQSKTDNDKQNNARLILFGHSWGASALVMLSRQLLQDEIPVSLTIQVDSVRKGQDDSVIPANVAEAINFYQPDGIVHGRSKITAADPSRTTILGNLRYKYAKAPAECRAYPWYDRFFFPGHTSIECDPAVWSQVETLIKSHLAPLTPQPQSTIATKAR